MRGAGCPPDPPRRPLRFVWASRFPCRGGEDAGVGQVLISANSPNRLRGFLFRSDFPHRPRSVRPRTARSQSWFGSASPRRFTFHRRKPAEIWPWWADWPANNVGGIHAPQSGRDGNCQNLRSSGPGIAARPLSDVGTSETLRTSLRSVHNVSDVPSSEWRGGGLPS